MVSLLRSSFLRLPTLRNELIANVAAVTPSVWMRQCSTSPGSNQSVIGEPDKLFRKIELEIKAYEPSVLRSYDTYLLLAANELGIQVGNCWSPRKHTLWRATLLKSAHVHKKHRVQYETRIYYRFMEFLRLTGSTADTFLEYIERNLPEGVHMKVTKFEIQRMPSHLVPPSKTEETLNEEEEETKKNSEKGRQSQQDTPQPSVL